MDALVPFVLGIIIGSLVTYFIIRSQQEKEIAKLNKIRKYKLHARDGQGRDRIAKKRRYSADAGLTGAPLTESTEKNSGVDSTELQQFLTSKGITIKSIPSKHDSDEVLGKLAYFMGERYALIKPFYKRIKSNLDSGNSVRIHLKKYTQEEISNICQLGNWLKQIAFLEEYKYQRSPRYILDARPNRIPQAINFLCGQWLEIFVKEQVIRLIESCHLGLRYSYLLNPKIVLPDGNDFELDILFKIEDEIFWFEAKTGDYQKHIEKYSRVSKILELDSEHSYMILTDVNESSTKALSSMFNMTVANAEHLAKYLQPSLAKYSDSSPA